MCLRKNRRYTAHNECRSERFEVEAEQRFPFARADSERERGVWVSIGGLGGGLKLIY